MMTVHELAEVMNVGGRLMRHNAIRAALGLLVLLAPIGAAADTIFRLDSPAAGATVFGLIEVNGWIGDDGQQCGTPPSWQACQATISLVSRIDVYVDDILIATADTNLPRYDVLQAFPWWAGTPIEHAGFRSSIDGTTFATGVHTVAIMVHFSDNPDVGVEYGRRSIRITNRYNQAPLGELELPGPNQPMNGIFPITGWALDDSAIEQVEILVDGYAEAGAVTGIGRPDIAHRFPSHPGADRAGFIRMFDTTVLSNGMHTVAVRLSDDEGAVRVVGHRFVQVYNTGSNLPPFGAIDWPIPNHIMFAKGCQPDGGWSTPPFADPQVTELVTGWALDIGLPGEDVGVAYVQLELDGRILVDTSYDQPVYWPWIEMDVDTYGLERFDVQRMFFDVVGAKDSGFAFRIDVADLINRRGRSQGLHYLKVRAGDLETNIADLATIPVIFDCDDDPDRPSFGDIYSPTELETVAGNVVVSGWAIDQDNIEDVQVFVDGDFIDYVDDANVRSEEVEDRYPYLPDFQTAHAGYLYDLDTVALELPDGQHSLVIRTIDRWDGETIVGERRFQVDNHKVSPATVPAGEGEAR